MSSKVMQKFKWFWSWQDAKQEEWLHRMSLDGWHLESPGRLFFTFERGPSKDFVYRLDYFNKSKMSILGTTQDRRSEYLGFFEDSGWEHLGQVNGWQYFRIPGFSQGNPETMIEVEPKIENYQRLLRNLLLVSPIYLIVFLGNLELYPTWFAVLLVSVFVGGLLYVALNGLMIISRIRELREG